MTKTYSGGMSAALALAFSLAVSATVNAVDIYDDGGTYNISGPSGAIEVRNGTTLNVLPGAQIVPIDRQNGILLTNGSTLNVSGGEIFGQTNIPGSGRTAVAIENSSVVISGGTLRGGGGFSSGGPALELDAGSTGQISGGELYGGPDNNGDISGEAVVSENDLTITGGTFEGVSAVLMTSGQAVISDGTFRGPIIVLTFGSSADLTILDGTFIVPSFRPGLDGIQIVPSGPISVQVQGGDFQQIGGGDPWWSLSGGTYSITGSNLSWVPNAMGSGPLTGTLSNGDPLSVTAFTDPDNTVIELIQPVSIEAETWSAIKARHR